VSTACCHRLRGLTLTSHPLTLTLSDTHIVILSPLTSHPHAPLPSRTCGPRCPRTLAAALRAQTESMVRAFLTDRRHRLTGLVPSHTFTLVALVDSDARATHPPSLSQMYGPCTLAQRSLFVGQRPGLVVHMHAESMPHIVPHSPQTCCRRVDTHMYACTITTMHTRTHARRQHVVIRLDATHAHSDNDDVHGETTTARAHTGRADEAAAASCTVQTRSDR
jgi:hypothetical protein